jgi:nucleotide-binding universal stress UspA family protein
MVDQKSLEKILVPVDGSGQGLQAAETAAIIAKKTGASTTILHIMRIAKPVGRLDAKINIPYYQYAEPYADLGPKYGVPASLMSELIRRQEQEGETIIADAEAIFKEDGLPVDTEIVRGKNPAEAILNKSEKGYDLIVMGAHGEHEKAPNVLGSVTKNVLRHTKCPTLIAKETCPLSSLLVCVDGSKHSIVALDYVANLAEKTGSKITLLNVQEPDLHEVAPEVCSTLADSIVTDALSSLKDRKLVADKKVECGVASDTIVEVAENGKHDLIVLGDKGLSSPRQFLFGSVSDDVAQKAKCSVLIVP